MSHSLNRPNSVSPPIVEGIVTTIDQTGSPHLAAMGPRLHVDAQQLVLRPFQGSQTLANLRSSGRGVFHVTDRPLQLARVVTGKQLDELTLTRHKRHYPVLGDVCSWYAFTVEQTELANPRSTFVCRVVERQHVRPWRGWNRAHHAVLELAILLTRVGIMPSDEILTQSAFVRPWVEKTGDVESHQAWDLLWSELQRRLAAVDTA